MGKQHGSEHLVQVICPCPQLQRSPAGLLLSLLAALVVFRLLQFSTGSNTPFGTTLLCARVGFGRVRCMVL